MLIVRILVALVLLTGAASAEGFSLLLSNHGTKDIAGLSLFPLDHNGEAIEDNLGGYQETVPPGEQVTVTLSGACGPMLAVVMLADGTELRASLDTCADTVLRVGD